MRRTRGQASLVMLLIFAMAFIFYAAELNWGRMSELKMTTWMAANGSVAQMASTFASYTERVMYENLLSEQAVEKQKWDIYDYNNGDIRVAQKGLLWLKIIVIIIVIIILIFTWGAAWPLVVLVATLMTVALILDYAVILPMQLSMWNKLMKNMQPIDQFKETGVQNGIMILATDNVMLPDHFDLNTNGRWGHNPNYAPAKPNDLISRFSLFYTERLKSIDTKQVIYAPPDYTAFQKAMRRLVKGSGNAGLGYSPFCGNNEFLGLVNADDIEESLQNGVVCVDNGDCSGAYPTCYQGTCSARTDTFNSDTIFTKLAEPTTQAVNPEWAYRENPQQIRLGAAFNLDHPATITALNNEFTTAKFNLFKAVLVRAQNDNFVSPLCNSKCTRHPSGITEIDAELGWNYGDPNLSNQEYFVPDQCLTCSSPFLPCPKYSAAQASVYRLLYDPYIESPLPELSTKPADIKNAYRVRLGKDDEVGKEGAGYDRNKTSGAIFPWLNDMTSFVKGKTTVPMATMLSTGLAGITGSQGLPLPSGYTLPQVTDTASNADVADAAYFQADLNSCAEDADPAVGDKIQWKKGADRYCSGKVDDPAYRTRDALGTQMLESEYIKKTFSNNTDKIFVQGDQGTTNTNVVIPQHFPYNECPYMFDSNGLSAPCSSSLTKNIYPQDRLDRLVYELPQLMSALNEIDDMDKEGFNIGINSWYPQQIAPLIAPKCTLDACNKLKVVNKSQQCDALPGNLGTTVSTAYLGAAFGDHASSPATCSPQIQGKMIRWAYDLKEWQERVWHYLYDVRPTDSGKTVLCPDPTRASGGLVGPKPSLTVGGQASMVLTPPTGATPPPNDTLSCLYAKSYYYQDLENCWLGTRNENNLQIGPSFPTGPTLSPRRDNTGGNVYYYPYMSLACKQVIKAVQTNKHYFIYDLPPSVKALGNIPSNVNTDWPPEDPQWGDPTFNDSPGPTGYSNKQIFEDMRNWVKNNWILETHTRQRFSHLHDRLAKSIDAYNVFSFGADKFTDFLKGPALTLMNIRRDQGLNNTIIGESVKYEHLPGFAIYGWKDHRKGFGYEGLWHIVRMEVSQVDDNDKALVLPTIFAYVEYKPEWYGPVDIHWFQLRDGQGNLYSRATRWDQSIQGAVRFNNDVPIWNFRFFKPFYGGINFDDIPSCKDLGDNPISDLGFNLTNFRAEINAVHQYDPRPVLDKYCGLPKNGVAISNAFKQIIGLGSDTQAGLFGGAQGCSGALATTKACIYPVGVTGLVTQPGTRSLAEAAQEKDDISNAFMFNYNPIDDKTWNNGTPTPKERACFCLANAILMRGITSYGNAEYWIPPINNPETHKWHTHVRFRDADDAKSKFPDNGTKPEDEKREE